MSHSARKSYHDIRREVRFPTRIEAVLSWPGHCVSIRIVDISNYGFMVEGDRLPLAGQRIRIRAKALEASGLVVWNEDSSCGILLEKPIHALGVVREHFCMTHRLEMGASESHQARSPIIEHPMRQARRWRETE